VNTPVVFSWSQAKRTPSEWSLLLFLNAKRESHDSSPVMTFLEDDSRRHLLFRSNFHWWNIIGVFDQEQEILARVSLGPDALLYLALKLRVMNQRILKPLLQRLVLSEDSFDGHRSWHGKLEVRIFVFEVLPNASSPSVESSSTFKTFQAFVGRHLSQHDRPKLHAACIFPSQSSQLWNSVKHEYCTLLFYTLRTQYTVRPIYIKQNGLCN
jgi:hypothetical protein